MVKNNIVLMSGKGQRFKDEGYKIPKPLLDLHGIPIIEKLLIIFHTLINGFLQLIKKSMSMKYL